MLLRKPFSVEGVESRHFELLRVLDCIPFCRVRSSSSRLLSDGCGLKGRNLLLKALHPMTCITISSLTLRLYIAWVVGLDVRLDFITNFMRRMEADGAV